MCLKYLLVAPTGKTNLEMAFGILFFSSVHFRFIGSAAELNFDFSMFKFYFK